MFRVKLFNQEPINLKNTHLLADGSVNFPLDMMTQLNITETIPIFEYVMLLFQFPLHALQTEIQTSVGMLSPQRYSESDENGVEYQYFRTQNEFYNKVMVMPTFNSYQLTINELRVEKYTHTGQSSIEQLIYYVQKYETEQDPFYSKSNIFVISLVMGDRVLIQNLRANFYKNLALAGGFLGAIIAVWQVMNICLYMKYKNRQARLT